jgi:hypothetical protein
MRTDVKREVRSLKIKNEKEWERRFMISKSQAQAKNKGYGSWKMK